jgi:hypothetical protein
VPPWIAGGSSKSRKRKRSFQSTKSAIETLQEKQMGFVKAVRKKAKLRLALTGPSGSGKTWGALEIAKGLGGKIACIDTENGSASLYSDRADFDVLTLAPPYSPERYIAAIKEAEEAGYDVLIIDSTTQEWSGSGGCLEINEHTAKSKFGGNTWSAWNETTPRHRKFIDSMLQANLHVIATGRSKTETAQVDGTNGRKKVAKLGMKTEQRDGFEYEFTVVLDLIHDGHFAQASKDRTGIFAGDAKPISEQTGVDLKAWLESGAEAPDLIAIHQPRIAQAEDMQALQSVYAEAYRAASAENDAHALAVLTDAKDTRKAELTQPTQEAA